MTFSFRHPIGFLLADMSKPTIKRDPKGEWVKNQTGLEFYVVKSNENFEKFYKAQNTCSNEDEWKECLAAMRRELPQGFRLDESSLHLNWVRQILQKHAENHDLLQSKPWSPDDLIWQMNKTSRWNLADKEELKSFHVFLQTQNQLGNISRQELVSMIPVLLLDVQPDHKVLDICASPGSKTKQVLSAMHAQAGALPSGVVIANEYDPSRCDKLCFNVGTVQSPCLMTVNHEGGNFPDMYLAEQKLLKFDRIVCDVPCSGDGTIRKNPNVWDGWTPGAGNGRHFVQYNIIERSVEMLNVGGMVAYSSCAINPIENEAVLGRLIKLSEGAIELVDVEGRLPGFKWAKGHTEWKVFDSEMNQYDKYEDVPKNVAQTQIHPGMFSSNYSPDIKLDRCMRLLPHHNDCGGFFVAILRKVKELPWENAMVESELLSSRLKRRNLGKLEMHLASKKSKQPLKFVQSRTKPVKNMWHKKSFFNFFDSTDEQFKNDLAFYDFPEQLQDPSLYYSSSDKDSKVYLTNTLVREIIRNSLKDSNSDVNLFHAGCRVFKKSNKKFCSVSQSIQRGNRLVPLMGPSRTVWVTKDDLRLLINLDTNQSLDVENGGLSEGVVKRMKDVSSSVGPIKIVCDCDGNDLILVGHLGTYKVNISIDRITKYHCQLMLGDKSI